MSTKQFQTEDAYNSMANLNKSHIASYQFWRFMDHLFGGKQPAQKFEGKRKVIQQKIVKDLKQNGTPATYEVERVCDISNYDLRKNYINKGIPVIIDGKAKNWDCVKKWSPDWLMDNYANVVKPE